MSEYKVDENYAVKESIQKQLNEFNNIIQKILKLDYNKKNDEFYNDFITNVLSNKISNKNKDITDINSVASVIQIKYAMINENIKADYEKHKENKEKDQTNTIQMKIIVYNYIYYLYYFYLSCKFFLKILNYCYELIKGDSSYTTQEGNLKKLLPFYKKYNNFCNAIYGYIPEKLYSLYNIADKKDIKRLNEISCYLLVVTSDIFINFYLLCISTKNKSPLIKLSNEEKKKICDDFISSFNQLYEEKKCTNKILYDTVQRIDELYLKDAEILNPEEIKDEKTDDTKIAQSEFHLPDNLTYKSFFDIKDGEGDIYNSLEIISRMIILTTKINFSNISINETLKEKIKHIIYDYYLLMIKKLIETGTSIEKIFYPHDLLYSIGLTIEYK